MNCGHTRHPVTNRLVPPVFAPELPHDRALYHIRGTVGSMRTGGKDVGTSFAA